MDIPLEQAESLCDIGRLFYDKGWSYGTSSNYSVVLSRDPFRLLITASGKDKRALSPHDFVIVDEFGKPVSTGAGKPSAETMLHVVAARRDGVNAVLHTHSTWGTVLSERFRSAGAVQLSGYEMLKGLRGITTHEATVSLRIIDNTQDIDAMSDDIIRMTDAGDESVAFGYLIHRHGMYTWGADLDEARRHVEVLEFLFGCHGLLEGAVASGSMTGSAVPG